MRCTISLLLLMLSVFFTLPAYAENAEEVTGVPIVKDSGHLMVTGRQIALWGISSLAGDQQCWLDNRAWDCGEQATTALKHFAEGKLLRCVIKYRKDGGYIAQCFRRKRGGTEDQDIAQYLVRHGWAMDLADESGEFYAQDQEKARLKRRGIWTSRFQTPEDWCEGVRKYIEYEVAPVPDISRLNSDTDVEDKTE